MLRILANANHNKTSLTPFIRSAGPVLLSAFSAAAIMYPMDLVRALQMANAGCGEKLTTIQLLKNFKTVHGFKGFFTQGLAPELAKSTWMRFLKFSLFPIVHKKIHGITVNNGTPKTKAIAAFISAVPESITIMPLELSKIALQLDTANRFNNNMFSAMGTILRERGPSGLMLGYLGIQYRQAMWSACYFASVKEFEKYIKTALVHVKSKNDANYEYSYDKGSQAIVQLLSGFVAGVFGAAFNTPGDTIRTVIQKSVIGGAVDVTPTFMGTARGIINDRGFAGLYAGFGSKAIHLGGGGALMAFFIPFFQTQLTKMMEI